MLKGAQLMLSKGRLPLPVDRAVMDAVTSVQVTTSVGQRSGFQLTLALSKRSTIAAGDFDPGTRLVISVLFNGSATVLIDGVITRQTLSPSNEPGATTLTMTGEDLTLLMDLDDHTGRPYPALPCFARVATILVPYLLYGVIPAPLPEIFPEFSLPIEKIPIHRGTDLEYINYMAQQVGYVFYLEPGPAPGVSFAYFGPEIRWGIPQRALNINMDAHTNVESVSFTLDGMNHESVVANVMLPIVKKSVPVPIPDIELLRPPLSIMPAPALRTTHRDYLAKLPIAEAIGRVLGGAARTNDGVTGQGTLDVVRYGQILKARSLVGVRGAGNDYDGLYFVTSVSHEIKRGEYKQSFSLARNGLKSIVSEVPV